MVLVAEKWLEYYWPLMESSRFLPQTQGETPDFGKPVAFRTLLNNLIRDYSAAGSLSAYVSDRDSGNFTPEVSAARKKLITKLKNTIIKGPVYYSGGGSSADKPFNWDKRTQSILISADLWREFALLGHWIRDSILIRWAGESRRMSGEEWKVSEVLDLLLRIPDPERSVNAARVLYTGLDSPECVWTGKTIPGPEKLHVDHAIPFSLWRDNSLWNLLPAAAGANGSKGDKLPTLPLLRKRREVIIGYWQLSHQAYPDRFRREAAGMIGPVPEVNWENLLFSTFIEAVETTAIRRGSERWNG